MLELLLDVIIAFAVFFNIMLYFIIRKKTSDEIDGACISKPKILNDSNNYNNNRDDDIDKSDDDDDADVKNFKTSSSNTTTTGNLLVRCRKSFRCSKCRRRL